MNIPFSNQIDSFQERDEATRLSNKLLNALGLPDCPKHVRGPARTLLACYKSFKVNKCGGVSHSSFCRLAKVWLRAIARVSGSQSADATKDKALHEAAKQRLAYLQHPHLPAHQKEESREYVIAYQNYLQGKKAVPRPRGYSEVVMTPAEFLRVTMRFAPARARVVKIKSPEELIAEAKARVMARSSVAITQ